MRRSRYGRAALGFAAWVAACALYSACTSKRPAPEHRDAAAPPPADSAAVDSKAVDSTSAPVDPWTDARSRGVAFRAIGQEPGWSVEVWDNVKSKRAVFHYAYGESTLAFDPVELTVDTSTARAVYRGENGGRSIALELRDGPCHDTMSGDSFETAVSVTLDERTYHGCGRSLR